MIQGADIRDAAEAETLPITSGKLRNRSIGKLFRFECLSPCVDAHRPSSLCAPWQAEFIGG
jgi:hypothetical protein